MRMKILLILCSLSPQVGKAELSLSSLRLLEQASKTHSIDFSLLKAIALVESRGKPEAINRKTHDYGLMQINHKTAAAYGHLPFEALKAEVSVSIAGQILRQLRTRFGHEKNWECRYNLGWGRNVLNWDSCLKYVYKLQKAGYNKHIYKLRKGKNL